MTLDRDASRLWPDAQSRVTDMSASTTPRLDSARICAHTTMQSTDKSSIHQVSLREAA